MSSGGGKVYLVYLLSRSGGESQLLAEVTKEDFMGIPCIKGISSPITSSSNWMAGNVIYIPADKVMTVAEFESIEAYREALKRHYEEKSK